MLKLLRCSQQVQTCDHLSGDFDFLERLLSTHSKEVWGLVLTQKQSSTLWSSYCDWSISVRFVAPFSPHLISFRYYNLEKCEHNLLLPYFLENSLKSWVSLLAQGIYIYTRSRKKKHPSTIFLSSSLTKWAEVLYLLYWIMCHLPLKCQSRLFWIPKWLHRSFSARWYGRRSL